MKIKARWIELSKMEQIFISLKYEPIPVVCFSRGNQILVFWVTFILNESENFKKKKRTNVYPLYSCMLGVKLVGLGDLVHPIFDHCSVLMIFSLICKWSWWETRQCRRMKINVCITSAHVVSNGLVNCILNSALVKCREFVHLKKQLTLENKASRDSISENKVLRVKRETGIQNKTRTRAKKNRAASANPLLRLSCLQAPTLPPRTDDEN